MTDQPTIVPTGSYQVTFIDCDLTKTNNEYITNMFFKIQNGDFKNKVIQLNFDLCGDDKDQYLAYLGAIHQAVGLEFTYKMELLLNKKFVLTVAEEICCFGISGSRYGKNRFASAESVSEYHLRKARI